ncbi:MAG TPA: hypothetical protein VJY35_11855 [Candidatus Eisenbacteria bacterium]|nr:hypothetical protein [Candidatus Eisenbacteria bacterium]
MRRARIHDRDQRGIAMVMALLVLLVISLLSATMLMSLNVDTKLAGHSMREAQALNIAEAGIGEAIARIRNGDIPATMNPRQVAQIFNTVAGSVPVLGADSIAMATAQQSGQWLAYSTIGKADSTLTVSYKTNNARTIIYRYDPNQNPAINLNNTGYPIYVIRSTGRKGSATRRIVTEVIQKPINTNIKGALTANVGVDFSGNNNICGHDHRYDTPEGKGDPGRSVVDGCYENPGANQWETGTGDKTGVWTSGAINNSGAAQAWGTPDQQAGQLGFYSGPWDALALNQSEFFSWVGAPYTSEPDPPNGIFYLDNDHVAGNQSGAFAYHSTNGEGLLYVDGDLTVNAGFVFRGLIYVEGDVKFNGDAWILGSLIVRGKSKVAANGGATLLYSSEAIKQTISKYGGAMVVLSWREVTN